ncbi:MAG: sulfite exporter TauE/SafE family protein [Ilumatobacteraceae bacterium]
MPPDPWSTVPPTIDLVLAGLGALAAGGINAVAGGGTLVSFPVLIGLGVPAVAANVTNTVALCPGYFGGAFAQREALQNHRPKLRRLLPVAGVGGLVGSILLIVTSEAVFRNMVPFLILLACGLLGFQDGIKRLVFSDRGAHQHPTASVPLMFAVFAAAVYGGYFGAGLGIMLLAVLGLLLDDELPKLNALKTMLSFVINVLAASFFVFSGKVEWGFAAVMAPASLVGGHLGGMAAGRLNPKVMRAVVIGFGVAVALRMLFF